MPDYSAAEIQKYLSFSHLSSKLRRKEQIKFQKYKINYKLTFYKPRKPFQRQEARQQPADGGWHMGTWLFAGEEKHNPPAKSFAIRLLAGHPQNPVNVYYAKCKT